MDLQAIGGRIKALREGCGFSQDALALSSGVARNSINDLEQGRGNPTLATLTALARAMGEPLIGLFIDENGNGKIPAESLNSEALAGLRQVQKVGRSQSAKRTAHIKPRGRPLAAKAPPDISSAARFLELFGNLKPRRKKLVSMLIYDDPAYLADDPLLARGAEALLKAPEPKQQT